MHFQYGNYHIPLVKNPCIGLVSVYLPLFLLTAINLTMFWTDNKFNLRVAGASTMMLALVALIPIIREQVPSGNRLTFIELVVYVEVLVTFLLLEESFLIRGASKGD